MKPTEICKCLATDSFCCSVSLPDACIGEIDILLRSTKDHKPRLKHKSGEVQFSFSPLLPISISQLRLLADQRNLLPGDEEMFNVCLDIQRIAIGNNHVRHFPDVERSQVFVYAEHLRRIERDGLERFVGGQTKGRGVARSIR